MSIKVNYTVLRLETLELILAMHIKDHLELLAGPLLNYQRELNLEKTIADIKHAISLKNEVCVLK